MNTTTVVAHKEHNVLVPADTMEHIEMVFVVMPLSQHKCAGAAQDTV